MFTVVVVRRAISTDESRPPKNILNIKTATTDASHAGISHLIQCVNSIRNSVSLAYLYVSCYFKSCSS